MSSAFVYYPVAPGEPMFAHDDSSMKSSTAMEATIITFLVGIVRSVHF
jgi:hypothetical protein